MDVVQVSLFYQTSIFGSFDEPQGLTAELTSAVVVPEQVRYGWLLPLLPDGLRTLQTIGANNVPAIWWWYFDRLPEPPQKANEALDALILG